MFVEDLLYPCLSFLLNEGYHPRIREKLIDIERQLAGAVYLGDAGRADEKKRQVLLEHVFDLLESISPKGCFFGPHPADPGRVGFWDKRLRDGAFERQLRAL